MSKAPNSPVGDGFAIPSNALIEEAKKLRGCYGESQYSKDLHKQLVELADGWQKIDKSTYEYWKDIDSEYTEWRLILQ